MAKIRKQASIENGIMEVLKILSEQEVIKRLVNHFMGYIG